MTFERKISVIVTTYNQEATIARALDSILRQRCSWPMEIIIGDDCSTDGTGDICRRYADLHPDSIRYVRNLANKGVRDNYFDCLLMANGTYLADLAGDDEWCDPYKLERELHLMEEHPEVVLVHTDYRLRNGLTGELTLASWYEQPRGITDGRALTSAIITQLSRPVVHLCTAMYRNDAFRRCYATHTAFFRSPDYPCEDLQLCALLSREGHFAYLDTITLNYTVACTSATNTGNDIRQFDFVRRVTQLGYDLQKALGIAANDPQLRRYFAYRVYALMMHAFRAHRPDLREQARRCAHLWHAKPELRTVIVAAITSCEWTWRVALAIRKSIKKTR